MAEGSEISRGYIVRELDRLIDKSEENGDDVDRIQLTVLRQIYVELADLKVEVNSNPFFRVGKFAKANPKTACILALMFLILLNMWAVPLLVAMGIPREVIP